MAAEAYKHGDRVAIVHERRDGWVYFHEQDEAARMVYWGRDFFRMPEPDFARYVSKAGVYDARQLPALKDRL